MSTVKNNNIFEKTSFLGGNSSEFIEELYNSLANARRGAENSHFKRMKEIFELRYPKEVSETWTDIREGLKDAVGATLNHILMINGNSKDVTDEEKYPNGLTSIRVGGEKLSRGLVLPGLMTSYFLRVSKPYDTLMQMGRWFGYRPGYESLCKIWLTEEMIDSFSFITQCIKELKQEFIDLERSRRPPSSFALKVRNHPGSLKITARNKMGAATSIRTRIKLSERETGTYSLPNNKISLDSNFDLTKNFVENLSILQPHTRVGIHNNKKGILYTSIESELIKNFIADFISSHYLTSPPDPIIDYINKRDHIDLKLWDVFINVPKEGIETSIRKKPEFRNNIPRRTINIANHNFYLSHRRFNEPTNQRREQIIEITKNNKICSDDFGKIGLSKEQLKIIKDRNPNSKDPKRYYLKGRKPLLVLHFLDLFEAIKINDSYQHERLELTTDASKCVTAWSFLVPTSQDKEEEAEYLVNQVVSSQKEFYGDDFDEELDDE